MMNNRTNSQAATLISRRAQKSKWPFILGCLSVLGVLALAISLGGYFFMTASVAPQAVVYIRAPQEGDRLAAGQPVQVRALARDERKIMRLELWVDGQLIDAQTSSTQSGINPFPLLTTWYPGAGNHTLIVRAFNGRGATSQATVNVEALTYPDRDADGTADEADACPDQPGNSAADGCPDRDYDGIADTLDACPDDAGLPEAGCPAPGAGDRDGDGLLDEADACPDEAGSPLAEGCRDTDGDGVGDASDACPTEPGAGVEGCPETAGEIIPEPEPGGAAPEPLPGVDPPVPGDEVAGPGFVFPFFWQAYPVSTSLEVEAYEMYVRNSYETVWCYVRLGDEDPRRYEFDTLGSQYWSIAEILGGENSIRLLHPISEPLQVWANCFGSYAGGEPEDMGVITALHPSQEWDGRELFASPEGENLFSVKYRICSPSCDETVLQAPLLAPITTGPIGNGPYTLHWRWDGDEREIGGFVIKRFMVDWDEDSIYVFNPAMRSLDLADYMPACGETVNFKIFAFRDTETGRAFSASSNVESWASDPCEYTASVTFMTLDVHNPPADEDTLHRPGPIYGEFWISNGTTVESLDFNACWCYAGPGVTLWGWCEGLKLQQGAYGINRDIFGWIERAQASCIGNGCNSNYYYAPASSSVRIPLKDGDDITIGGRIMDCDERANASDVLYEEQETITINVADLAHLTDPITRVLNGDHVNLDYFIRLGR